MPCHSFHVLASHTQNMLSYHQEQTVNWPKLVS